MIPSLKQVPPPSFSLESTKLRVNLRPLSSQDCDQFMKWATDDEVTSTLTWNSYKDRSQAESFLNNVVERHPWFKAICVNNLVIGSITLDKKHLFGEDVAEVGYVVAKEFWGHGYAAEAVYVAINECLKDLGVSKVIAFVDPEHFPSQRVLEKVGFSLNAKLPQFREIKGMMKDRLFYSKQI